MSNSSKSSQQSNVYNPLISVPTCNYQIYPDVVLEGGDSVNKNVFRLEQTKKIFCQRACFTSLKYYNKFCTPKKKSKCISRGIHGGMLVYVFWKTTNGGMTGIFWKCMGTGTDLEKKSPKTIANASCAVFALLGVKAAGAGQY